jgi:hypothetical protein
VLVHRESLPIDEHMSNTEAVHATKRSRCDDACDQLRVTLGERQIYPPTIDYERKPIRCTVIDRMRSDAAVDVLRLLDPEWQYTPDMQIPNLSLYARVKGAGVYITTDHGLSIHLQMQTSKASVVWKSTRWTFHQAGKSQIVWTQKIPSRDALFPVWKIAARVLCYKLEDLEMLDEIDRAIEPRCDSTGSDARIFEEA